MRCNLVTFRKQLQPTAEEIEKRPNGSKKKKGLTQKEMAHRLGITKITYTNLELGNTNPSYNLLERFSQVFEYEDIWELFKKFQ